MTTTLPALHFDNILIWRHAQAEVIRPGQTDEARQLTQKGHLQAKRMSRWLEKHLPIDTVIVSSTAARAAQTAKALSDKITLLDGLKPDADLTNVLAALNRIQIDIQKNQQKNILIIAHQPWLEQLLAYLFNPATENTLSRETDIPTYTKKGAVWWLRPSSSKSIAPYNSTAHQQYKLFTLQTPNLL